MYIGALAKLTSASRKAIRHYKSLGLIPVPQRKGRYRIDSEADAKLICMKWNYSAILKGAKCSASYSQNSAGKSEALLCKIDVVSAAGRSRIFLAV